MWDFYSKKVNTVCAAPKIGGGGGGGGVRDGEGGFQESVWSFFPRLWKQKQGHFLTQKESARHISVDSEQIGNCHLGPACTDPFN